MTQTNPLRIRRARHTAIVVAAVMGVAALATTLMTVGEDAQARPATRVTAIGSSSEAAAEPEVTDDSELIADLGQAWRTSTAAKAEQVRQFLEAAAAAESARLAAERAAAEAAAAEAAAATSRNAMGGGWAALRRCESGGNYRAISANGTYRGAYQFSRSTWNSVASRNLPHLVGVDPAAAAPADQDAMALALFRSSGSGPWPHCGKHL